uniref:Uncharacterized protein n=1 Tax=Anguilla anguilla TaxID=7936 RepID=A0A0E9UE59_ANGAN
MTFTVCVFLVTVFCTIMCEVRHVL